MNNKTLIGIVAVVAVVALVGAGCVVVFNNNGGNNDDFTATTRLLVYGNANEDNYLDDKDVAFIGDIADGKATWDKEKNPFADANNDGKVDAADKALVQKFIKGEKAEMLYKNWYGEVCSVHYPVAGPIAGTMVQTLDLCYIVGAYNDVVGIKDNAATIATYNPMLYPGAAEKIKTVRGDTNVFDVSKMLALGVKTVIGDTAAQTPEFIKSITTADPEVNCIQLPMNRVVNNVDWTYTIVTLGVMMNHQSATKAYIDYLNDVEKALAKKLDALKDKDPLTFNIAYRLGETSSTTTNIDTEGTGAVQYGDCMNMLKLGLKSKIKSSVADGYLRDYPVQDLLAANPDIIFVETWNMISTTMTETEYMDVLKYRVDLVSESGAYENNRVITMAYEIYGTIPAASGLFAMGHLIWPDVFSEEEGINFLNDYMRNFTQAGKTFDVREHLGFAPMLWGKDIKN
ncbi:MAG: hypothetical protein MJZ38_06755 [archaeon]|nr:hypothetical protein [archaeon]